MMALSASGIFLSIEVALVSGELENTSLNLADSRGWSRLGLMMKWVSTKSLRRSLG